MIVKPIHGPLRCHMHSKYATSPSNSGTSSGDRPWPRCRRSTPGIQKFTVDPSRSLLRSTRSMEMRLYMAASGPRQARGALAGGFLVHPAVGEGDEAGSPLHPPAGRARPLDEAGHVADRGPFIAAPQFDQAADDRV